MDNCLRPVSTQRSTSGTRRSTKEAGRNPGKMRNPSSGKFFTRMSRSVQPLIRDTPVCQQRSRQESTVRTRNVSVPPTWVARVDATHWPNDRWVAGTHVPGGSAIPARGGAQSHIEHASSRPAPPSGVPDQRGTVPGLRPPARSRTSLPAMAVGLSSYVSGSARARRTKCASGSTFLPFRRTARALVDLKLDVHVKGFAVRGVLCPYLQGGDAGP